uniref:Thyrotropin receptor n=1 Tax=Clarias gariepinus TaxID=13013 RepID=Q7ZZZ8_CLAGA|nr:thyroid-stimulating hormone receptor [Clarias gariepinus]
MRLFALVLITVFSHQTCSEDFNSCPKGCECTEWKGYYVSCTDIGTMPRFPGNTETLHLYETRLSSVPQDAFVNMVNISLIYLSVDVTLRRLEKHSFYALKKITHIEIRNTRSLTTIDPEAFKDLPKLKYLGLFNTGLTIFPALTRIHSEELSFMLEITDNIYISEIPANAFQGITKDMLTVMLYSNGFAKIQHHAFNGTSLDAVYLHRNGRLTYLSEDMFTETISGPVLLDLSDSRVTSLPSRGLETLRELSARNVWSLKKLPPVETFRHLISADMTYPSHCCAFKNLKKKKRYLDYIICNLTAKHGRDIKRLATVTVPALMDGIDKGIDMSNSLLRKTYDHHDFLSNLHYPDLLDEHSYHDMGFGDALKNPQVSTSQDIDSHYDYVICEDGETVTCTPAPDDFNPCEDIMGFSFLRVSVWFVSLLAVFGNSVVLFVLLTSHYKLSVSRFLMCHLAFADLCLGIYLLFIASVDLYTQSEYYNHAIDWQTGPWCTVAGVISIFASELSVYTLTTITLERWHAINFAMQLDRKLHLSHASAVMLVGWILSLLLALMPVLGVSSYQKVSICLPMSTENLLDQVYILFMLVINIVAFVVICACYIKIYYAVHNPTYTSASKDSSIAKRMAVLIFTDFLCIAPISFYAISAALDHPLISISNSKILLVLFYPLNSCANPFLYAVFTKAFQGDVFILLSKIGLCEKKAQLYRGQTISTKASSRDTNSHGINTEILKRWNVQATATCNQSGIKKDTNTSRGRKCKPTGHKFKQIKAMNSCGVFC